MPDKAVASGGGTEGGEATGFDAQLLSNIPGGEMLAGATANIPENEFAEAADWTPEGAEEDDEGAGVAKDPKAGDEDEDEDEEDETGEAGADADTAPTDAEKSLEEADWPEAARTKIAAIAAEKEALAGEVAELKAKAPEPIIAPSPSIPLANVSTEEGLSYHADLARSIKAWAIRNLANGGEFPAELQARIEGRKPEEITEARTLTADEAAGMLERSEGMLAQVIPARREYLSLEKETREFLKATYPSYLDAKTEEGKLYSGFLAQFPQIKQLPRWPTVLAAVVRGHMEMEKDHKARTDKTKGKAEPAPKAPVPPGRGAAGASPKPGKPGNNPAARAKQPKLSASMDAEQLAAALR